MENRTCFSKSEIIQRIIGSTKPGIYLEIGVNTGRNFLKVKAKSKIGVDPEFRISFKNKILGFFINPFNLSNKYFKVPSDSFFESHIEMLDKNRPRVIFVDGLHVYRQALKDILNTLRFMNEDGVIVVDDCNPPSKAIATPFKSYKEFLDSEVKEWCGDVWKAIVYLRSMRDDLNIFVLDCEHGIGIITKGKPDGILNLSGTAIDNLSYEDLEKDRRLLINLKEPEYFEVFIRRLREGY